ncbi:longitudinals lacking protein, isoforms H/M/V [Anopheles ziemanni]|uniref:longitudinals lacking protein, isoforms H/M/V n=1 Tax=Anopheles ziemanni TaxID=345580 RepID=UPI00265DD2F0|nr:longitudinals lacking protein, isoforms H/M/V [Anopheles ziemanni]
MTPQQFSLRWNNYSTYIAGAFDSLRYEEDFVDVTLCCEGRKIRAHKILLSACSPYFKEVFKENPCQHPVIIFKNVRYTDLMSLVEFMYQGEVSVAQEQLPSFLHTAELLSIRGLTDSASETRPAGSGTSSITQLIHTPPVLEKSTTITSADSVFLTIPSNTIVHQPKLVQSQIQTTPVIGKAIIKPAPSEMPALTTATATITVPITQQQPTLTKIQMQAPQQPSVQPQSAQQQQQQQQQQQVHAQIHQVQHTSSQQGTQQSSSLQTQASQQAPQATTLQEVVDHVVQPRKKKIKVQQIIASQASSSIPATATVTVTATGSSQSNDGEIFEKFESETYTITTTKDDQRADQEQETYAESGQQNTSGMKMEIPEFISLGEPITGTSSGNNTFIQEGYELVSEDKDEDDEDMAQDHIEIEGADMDMSRIFQESTDEQTKSNILKVSVNRLDVTGEEKPYKCPECRRSFCSMNAMKRHRQAKHSNSQDSFTCLLCEARFKTKWSLSTHKSKYHRGQNTSIMTRATGSTSATATTSTTGVGTESSSRSSTNKASTNLTRSNSPTGASAQKRGMITARLKSHSSDDE